MKGERAVTPADIPSATVVHCLQQRAQHTPERSVVGFLSEDGGAPQLLGFAQLERRARAIAAALMAMGARGERALLMHAPGLDYVAAVYGCFYAGVTAVPAYPPRRGRGLQRLCGIAADCTPRLALTDSASLSRSRAIAQGDALLAGLEWACSDQLAQRDELYDGPLPERDALALLQYTSGSTSEPKGVELTHAQLAHNLLQVTARSAITSADRVVLWLPPYHDLGLVSGVLLPVWTGATVFALSPAAFLQRPARWLEAISTLRGTLSASPNFGYELCARRIGEAQRAGLDLRSWRVALSGAERVSPDTIERFTSAFAPHGFERTAFAPAYGLAEATVGVTMGSRARPATVRVFDSAALGRGRAELAAPGAPGRSLIGAGVALRGTELAIVEPVTRAALRPGQVGEIWVQGPSVARGYWRRPELSAQVFHARLSDDSTAGEYLRTGDLGFVRDGELFVVGRIKDLLIVAGINYYPDDIEMAVAACDRELRGAIAAFAVDVANEEQLVIVAEVEPKSARGSEISAAIRAAVAEALELDVHEVVLVRPGSVPRTSSGKVQRGQCRSAFLSGELATIGGASPANGTPVPTPVPAELLASVLAIFRELLAHDALAADDDFFVAGGHSLAATRLLSRVREQLGVELPIRAVFEARSARALAARIASLPRTVAGTAVGAVDRAGRLRLSFSQERMWFLHQLEPHSAAYNVAGAVEVRGPLDAELLARAFVALLARHEILRSNYPAVAGEPRVVIANERSLQLERSELAAEADPLRAALELGSRLANAPFDVARDPLLRAALYRIGHARHVICVVMHHLISDAWSLGVLAEDLFALYAAFARGEPAPARAHAWDYVDYAAWQRGPDAQTHHARELSYWKRQLNGAQPLELTGDHPRSSRFDSAGAFEPLALPEPLIAALRARATEHGATLFMVMLAAFELLLYRYSGQSDLVVGVPIANRNRLASEPLIGTLVNTLAFRLQLNPDATCAELLAQVREVALDAYAHQDLPFERLVAELGLERAPGRSPLVQVMFDFQNAPLRGFSDGGLSLRPLLLSRGASQFDLSLLILDTELGRTAGIEYRSGLFEQATIQRMLAGYLRILHAIAEQPERPLAQVTLLDPSEQAAVIAAGHGAQPDAPFASVLELFAQQARRTPDAPALLDAHATLDYRTLDARSDALASDLRMLGAQPGERIAVYLERSSAVVVALLAVLKTGAAYVPLDPLYPPARLAMLLGDCDPRVVITGSALLSNLTPELAARALALDLSGGLRGSNPDDPPARSPAPPAPPAPLAPEPERIAYVLYTSGSTGRPKGVEVSQRAFANLVRSIAHTPGLHAHDRLLAVTTVAFDIAALEIFVPLCTGASLYMAPAEVVADGGALLECIAALRPSALQATPSTWKMLLDAGWQGSPELTILCGGEALSPQLARALCARGRAVWNLYGPTETTIWSTVQQVQQVHGELATVPVGKAIDHTQLYVLDPQRQLAAFGAPGEIAIAGRGVAQGYFRDRAQTAQRFVADPFAHVPSDRGDQRMYLTGDRGRLLPDGTLLCLGRLDAQIKIRGHRVEPAEIEALIKDELDVRDAVVIAREDRPGDTRLTAYCVLAEGAALEPTAAVRERLRRKLPEYMVPAHFVALAQLPLTPNGKIDRRALPRPEPGRALSASYQAPRDALETRLASLWQHVLELPRVGISDNFFELGGHSLLAVRLFAAIELELGVILPLTAVLETRTLAELAERVRRALAGGPQRRNTPSAGLTHTRHAVLLRPGAGRTPVFLVHGAGGNVLNLRALAYALPEGRAVYGFVARGSDGIGPLAASIEEMAESYLADARAIQPHGPLHLVGYCGGGLVAYEMARVLSAAGTQAGLAGQGARAGLVGLIDSYHPRVDTLPARITLMLDGVRREGPIYTVRRVIHRLQRELSALRIKLRLRLALLRRVVPFALRDYWLTTGFFRLAAAYEPQPYPGQVTIFHAAEKDPLLLDVGPELGWSELVAGAIEVAEVPGNHDTLALEPNVTTLAQKLGAALDLADDRARRGQ